MEEHDSGPGDSRSIENPTDADPERLPGELPVEGEQADDVGSGDERVSEPGEGLVTKEGVNESDT